MSGRPVVIGIGNVNRRDDGIGPAVATALAGTPGLDVVTAPAEPTAILDAWTGRGLAVLVDAAVGGRPGRVLIASVDRRLDEMADDTRPVSSHDLSLRQTYELARVLGRAPDSVVVVTVDVGDTGYGDGLSASVAAALPEAVRVVERIVAQQAEKSVDEQP